MHFTKLLSLIFFATLASHVQAASDACCDCIDESLFTNNAHCGDGTSCTPYCGYGPCNFFGCDCDGGCRVPGSISGTVGFPAAGTARSLAHTDLAAAGATEDRFNAADTDNDGQLTFEEWASSDQNKKMDKSVLAAHWAKFDNANVGYLTKADVASRIA
ncbi:hypothetical protein BD779DRAFT_1674166 [Infundibulicybe gibba]|nr:hypothetical protein BD779DRAFT_1674166 [Infundibulicybe gibba]